MNMMKLSIKTLIQSALSLGRTLDSDFPPLQQFFVVLEHCLKHGLKGGCPPARGGGQSQEPLAASAHRLVRDVGINRTHHATAA